MTALRSTTLVGRESVLDRYRRVLGIEQEQQPRHLLLGGDAGVGKTRILTTLRDDATSAGWLVVPGHCLDFGESALAYLPFTEVVARIEARSPELIAELSAAHPALARLRAGNRRDRPGGSEQPPELSEPASSRADLYACLHTLIERLADASPLLLIIEDAHWADRSTRDLLSFLFTREYAGRVAIAVSYRADDLHRRHPLRTQLGQWARMPQVVREVLEPLPRNAGRSLVRALDPSLPAAEVDLIVARAEGNAFFIEELVGATGCCADVPEDLADLLLLRLDPLSRSARDVIGFASVAGRRVRDELLAAAAPLPDLQQGLREAVDANVLVPRGDAFEFRHALLGEAVYDDLLPGERVRMHAAYAGVLRDRPAIGTAAELARHAAAAQDRRTALLAGIEAGDDAMAVGGADEAAQHYLQALELVADPALAAELDLDVSRLAVCAAEALSAAGQVPRAADLLTDQLRHLGEEAPPQWRARLLVARAKALAASDTEEDIAALTAEAVALLPPDHESGLRAHVLAAHAHHLAYEHRYDEARAAAEEAAELAERLDRPLIAVDVSITLGGLDQDASPDRAIESLERALSRAQRAGSVLLELRARFQLGRLHEEQGRFAEAIDWFSSGMDLGRRVGTPWAPYAMDCWLNLAWCHLFTGEWDRTLDLLSPTVTRPEIPDALARTGRAQVEVARGGEPDLSSLRRLWPNEGLLAVFGASVGIEIAGRRGDIEQVVAEFHDAVAVGSALWTPTFPARLRLGAVALAALAQSLPRLPSEDRAGCLQLAEQFVQGREQVLQRWARPTSGWGPEGRYWDSRMTAELLRVHWLAGVEPPTADELHASWTEVLTRAEEWGEVAQLAVAATTLAEVLRATGDPAGAGRLAARARQLADRLGAKPLLQRLDAIDRPARTASLTAREQEILVLLAEGLTNGEIGKRLFISTKTVSVHVSNILAKLGAAGRTEAAAIARRQGLLD